jgi:hypothetical protein
MTPGAGRRRAHPNCPEAPPTAAGAGAFPGPGWLRRAGGSYPGPVRPISRSSAWEKRS